MYYAILSSLVILTYSIGIVKLVKGTMEYKVLLLIFVFTFSLVLAYRPTVFPDTSSYNKIYDEIDIHCDYGFDLFGEYLTVEYGFLYFMKLCKILGLSVNLCYFLFNIITIEITLYATQKIIYLESNRSIVVNQYQLLSLYMSFFGIYYLGIAMREGICLALLFYIIAELKEKKIGRAVIGFMIGYICHRLMVLSVIVILIYFWGDIQFKKKTYWLVWLISGIYILFNTSTRIQSFIASIMTILLPYIRMESFLGYIEDYFGNTFSFSWLNFIVWIYIGLLTILYFRNDYHRSVLNIVYVGLIISLLLYTMQGSSRIYDFFTIFSIISVTISAKKIRHSKKSACRIVNRSIMIAIEVGGLFLNYYIVFLRK